MVTCLVQYLKRRPRGRDIPGGGGITGTHYPVVWERFCELEERQYSKVLVQHDIILPSKPHCHSSTMENIVSSVVIPKTLKTDTL